MKPSEKTDSSVKELWEIVDNLADNRSPWFIIGKNGKAQKPSEPTKKTTRKKSEVSNANIREQYYEKYETSSPYK